MQHFNEYNEKKFKLYEKKDNFYSDDILCFDIETSQMWKKKGKIIDNPLLINDDDFKNLEGFSLCYLWQFGFNDRVYYGRKLEEFINILDTIPKFVNCCIYVHNLSYEFTFLNNILTPLKVFARTAYRPIKVVFAEYPNIEFRCSYILTRLSLDEWSKKTGKRQKQTGTIDYNIIRTPNSILEKNVLIYGEYDILSMYDGLYEYKEKYEHVHDIPLTQTGCVRRKVKKILFQKEKNWVQYVSKLLPKDYEALKFLCDCFMGGYVHANFIYVGEIIKNVTSFDFCSSYPFVMCSEKFPMGQLFYKEYNEKDNDYFYFLEIELTNIHSKTKTHYISKHKCFEYENLVCDNGRVMKGDKLKLKCTHLDLKIIEQLYDCNIKVIKSYASSLGYLPKSYIEYILELYKDKTSYKDVEEFKSTYRTSKEEINALFGMFCTALIPDDVYFNAQKHEWGYSDKTEEDINKYLNELRKEPKGRVFLAFQWGVAVTAFARYNLFSCILRDDKGKSCDLDNVYNDTDSAKLTGKHSFKWYNAQCDIKLKEMCNKYSIPFELTRPKDKLGIEHPLGHFEQEYTAKEFVTLGCKRYCYRDTKNELHLTCSGVNKQAVSLLDDDITNFKNNFKFKKCDKEGNENKDLKTLTMSHTFDMPITIWKEGEKDEYKSYYTCGVISHKRNYTLNIKDDFLDLISQERHSNSILL